MHAHVRRATTVAAALVLGVAGLVAAPTVAGAAGSLPEPTADGFAYYTGDDVAYELDWVAPAPTNTVGTTLVGYEAKLYTGAPTFSTVVANSTTTAICDGLFIFDDLAVGQKYQGVVRAVYSVDHAPDPATTEHSDWAAGAVASALYPAPRVKALTAKATGPGVVTVAWVKPTPGVNQEGVGGYSISASPVLSFDDLMDPDYQFEMVGKSVDASDTRTALRGLKPGIRYDLTVHTVGGSDDLSGGFGFGDLASTSVKVLGTPGKPAKLTATTLSSSKTKLAWKRAKATKAHPVTGYKVYVNGKLKATLGKRADSYTVKNQKAGKRYTYTVRAYNEVALSAKVSLTK